MSSISRKDKFRLDNEMMNEEKTSNFVLEMLITGRSSTVIIATIKLLYILQISTAVLEPISNFRFQGKWLI